MYPLQQKRHIELMFTVQLTVQYSYIANSTNSIYSISNRLSSAPVSATLSIHRSSLSFVINICIIFAVYGSPYIG